MGLQKCGLNLNRVSRELQPYMEHMIFPVPDTHHLHTDKPEDAIPWHWHKIEIIYVRDGTIKLQIPLNHFY